MTPTISAATELAHEPHPGDEFIPAGWRIACEHCSAAPTICLACSYRGTNPSEWSPVSECRLRRTENPATKEPS